MRRLFQISALIFGLLLLVSLGVLWGPRQEVSGAYWLLENDTVLYPSVLYRTLPDGSQRRPILVGEVPYQNLVWWADTRHFYYATHTMAGFTVRQLNSSGLARRTIIEPRPADITTTEPSPLSPDGKYMIYLFYGGGAANRIIRTDADGSNLTEIYEGDIGSYEGLIWSPDSQWIYFAGDGYD